MMRTVDEKQTAASIRRVIDTVARPGSGETAVDVLSAAGGLSKARVKDAMNKGAAWVWRGRRRRRQRRATAVIAPGTRMTLYYDTAILGVTPPPARCLVDRTDYSAWYKPAGLLTQGTDYGDHCSLLRQVEIHFAPRRRALPVHRLDREVAGVVLVAHNARAAAALSRLFQQRRIEKRYRAEILGCPAWGASEMVIDLPLDGKGAVTRVRVAACGDARNISTVDIVIDTGRKHQIRRHLDLMGHPVMGDPLYGTGNKNVDGMRLKAVGLSFTCPISRQPVRIALPQGEMDP
jgi:tRNA pseudouridine32 synthase/23S rRNA pseudouridine746 synthase